jgi:hypothetical protein
MSDSMEKPLFDAASFLEIDLTRGSISSAGKEQLALVPTQVLRALEPGDALDAAASDWGHAHGRRLAEQVDLDADNTSLEALASHLGGTLAAFGMGRLSVEIRGSALLFRTGWDGDPALTEGMSALLEGFLAGYLSALGTQPFAAVHLGKDSQGRLFWAGNPDAAKEVRRLVATGADPEGVITALMSR